MAELCPRWCGGDHVEEREFGERYQEPSAELAGGPPESPGLWHMSGRVDVAVEWPGRPIGVRVRGYRGADGTWQVFVSIGRQGEDALDLPLEAAGQLGRYLVDTVDLLAADSGGGGG
jgi:hypothetical protein